MHFTLIDDSIPFDGYTASVRALGGAEKAFAALPGALARRGHSVTAFNCCRWSMFIEGAQWEPLDAVKPLVTDVLIAFRKVKLLESVRQPRRRVLWTTTPARLLDKKTSRDLIQEHKPLVLMCSQAQAAGWNFKGVSAALLPAALKNDFLAPVTPAPKAPARAIVTSHPAHGLDWLVDLWTSRIHPAAPEAELHIYSVGLAKDEPPPELADLAAKIRAARDMGVRVLRPLGDAMMAQAYREARVHLYPGHVDDCTAFTLMESQACGLPAVLRPMGAAPERVTDGSSAYVVPDDDAFANLAALLLSNDQVQAAMGAEARARYGGCTWDAAAEMLEGILS